MSTEKNLNNLVINKVESQEVYNYMKANSLINEDELYLVEGENEITITEATETESGLMSASDKVKLNGIEDGANKTIVDSTLSSTSGNPVQNKVINSKFDEIKVSIAGKVDIVSGKGLSTNDYTTNEKNKLSGIAVGADVSTIKSISKNGTALSIDSNKNVNIEVPTKVSQLSNDSGYLTEHQDISGKQDKITGAATTIASSNLTANRALISNGSGKVAVSDVTSTQLGYLNSVTSNVQSQLNEKAPLASPALTGTPTAPTADASVNNTQIATTAYVKTAINNVLNASNAMVFKGTIGTNGSVTSLPTSHQVGDVYVVSTAGSYAGQTCEVGDMIVCTITGTASKNNDWTVVQSNINGAVTGPSSSVNSHVAIFDGSTGKVIKDSGFTIGTNVPSNAVFTDTVYTHPSYTAKTGVPTANQTPSFGGKFTVT